MIKVNHLSASYKTLTGDIPAVSDVDFEIYETRSLASPENPAAANPLCSRRSTTSFSIPFRLTKVLWFSREKRTARRLPIKPERFARGWWNNISYVPQAAMSVLNPTSKLKSQFLDSIPEQDRKKESKEQILQRVRGYLKELNLSGEVLEAYPFQLSGGMRHRE